MWKPLDVEGWMLDFQHVFPLRFALINALALTSALAAKPATVDVRVFEWPANRELPAKNADVAAMKDVVNESVAVAEIVSGKDLSLACVVPDAMVWHDMGREGLLVHLLPTIQGGRITFRFAFENAYFEKDVRSGPIDPAKSRIATSSEVLIGVPIFGRASLQTNLQATTGFGEPVVLLLRTLPAMKQKNGESVSMYQYAVLTFSQAD